MKASRDNGSVHVIADSETAPVIPSNMPDVAVGANSAESDRFRKLQSSKITRAPVCAMSNARAAATVDFPSLDRVDVIPITWIFLPLRVIESIASLISRNDLVNGDCGASVTVHIGLSVRTISRDLG